MTGTLAAILASGSVPAGCIEIPIFPADLDIAGLVGWWVFDDAEVDGSNNIIELPPRVGDLSFVPSAPASAPVLVASTNGKKEMGTTIAGNNRLILEPAPAGAAWPNANVPTFSFLMRFKSLDATATIKGICNLFGLQVREYSAAHVQIQHAYTGGTQTLTSNYVTNVDTVLGITGDYTDPNNVIIKIYRNGVLVASDTSANYSPEGATVACIGSVANPGTPGNANSGDIYMYDVVKTPDEMLAISNYITGSYS